MMKMEFEITRQEYADLNFHHFKKKRLVRYVITGLISLVFLQIALNMNSRPVNIGKIIVTSLLFILLYSVIIYFQLQRVHKLPGDNGAMLGKRSCEFSDDGLVIKSNDTEGKYQWQAVKSFEETKKAFYLYLDTIMVLPFPKRYFSDQNEEKAFRSLLERKIQKG